MTQKLQKPEHQAFTYCGWCGAKDSLRIIEGSDYHNYLACFQCFNAPAFRMAHYDDIALALAQAQSYWQAEFIIYGKEPFLKAVYEETEEVVND